MHGKTRKFLAALPELGQVAQQIGFYYFSSCFFVTFVVAMKLWHSRWTFYEVVKIYYSLQRKRKTIIC